MRLNWLSTLWGKVHTYDANGRMTKRVVYDEKGKVLDTTVWSYDSRGNITEIATYNPDGSLNSKRRTAYEFDTVGNWVKLNRSKLVHKNGKTFYEMEEANYRTIAYYGIDAAPVTESAIQENAAVKPGNANEKIDDDRNLQSRASKEEIPQERTPSVPKVIRKSGGVLQKDATKRARPVYPPLARAAKVSGKVEVELRVDEEGNVISTKIISGHSLLRDAAAEAAKQWKFKPTKLSGVAVQVIGVITFNFELDDSATGNNDIDALENAARNNPNSAEAHYELGAAYYRLNRYDEAIRALKESIRIKPESADAHKKLGLAYGALKLYSVAEAELAEAIRINPEDTEAVAASGLVLAALYRYDEAIKAFKEGIEREPQIAETYSYLVMTYSALGRKKDAIAAFKQGLKIYPDDAKAHYRLGLLYIELGNKETAMETYGALKKLDGRLADSLLREINQ